MHALGEQLGHEFPTGRAALRRFELARVAQMQSRTSFFRFVREHLMRHAACAERHRFFATADAQRGAAAAMLHQLPSSGIGIGEARETPDRLESREPGRLPGLDATEERLKGKVQASQRLLQGVAAERNELGPIGLDVGQRVFFADQSS